MNFQHIGAYGEAGRKALVAYGLAGEYRLELHHRSENVTYLVVHRETERRYAAMRVSRPGYHTLEETESEMRWLDRIVKEGTVTIARPIRSLEGQSVVCEHVDGVTYHCVLCEYLEGKAPNPEDGERGYWWFQKTGEAAAKLHRQTMEWKESSSLCRPVWDYEALLGESGLFGNWRTCEELGDEGFCLLDEVCGQIRRHLWEYGRDPDRFGLIHTDLRAANLLVDDREIKILDFDDCGFGWHLFDLAASLSFMEDHPMAKMWIMSWLKGYTSVRRLAPRDFNMIPTFLMARRIQLLAWIISHNDSEPVKLYEEGFMDGTIRMAGKYRKYE